MLEAGPMLTCAVTYGALPLLLPWLSHKVASARFSFVATAHSRLKANLGSKNVS